MTTDTVQHFALLDDLDARQNEVIGQLDDLNDRIESLLANFNARTPARPAADDESASAECGQLGTADILRDS